MATEAGHRTRVRVTLADIAGCKACLQALHDKAEAARSAGVLMATAECLAVLDEAVEFDGVDE